MCIRDSIYIMCFLQRVVEPPSIGLGEDPYGFILVKLVWDEDSMAISLARSLQLLAARLPAVAAPMVQEFSGAARLCPRLGGGE